MTVETVGMAKTSLWPPGFELGVEALGGKVVPLTHQKENEKMMSTYIHCNHTFTLNKVSLLGVFNRANLARNSLLQHEKILDDF